MKNTKVCPKCQSNDIIRIDGYVDSGGAGNNIRLGMTAWSAVHVNRYICCNCGFTEEWLDEVDVEKAKNSSKARRVN